MGDTRHHKLPVILAILAALAVGFATPASASFTSLTPAPTTASSLAASVETPTPSLGMRLSRSRTPTGPRPYFGARYYGSRIGRFTTVDPVVDVKGSLVNPQKWNRYAYTLNNPLRYVDPDGRVERTPIDARLIASARAAGGYKDDDPLAGYMSGAMLTLLAAPLAMLAVEFAPAFLIEAQIAGGGCAASPGCRGGIQDIAEGLSGTPPGPRGDWAQLSGALRQAARGKGNFGIGSATVEQAEAMGRAWVGEGATLASDGKTLTSANGLRQYRPPSYKPKLGRHQANLEGRSEPAGQWQSNAHVDITDKQ